MVITKNNGRTVVSNYGGLYSQTIKLNAFGEVVEVIDGENNTIKYEYDSLGRQNRLEDSQSYFYDDVAVYLTYDVMGIETKRQYKNGVSENTVYDKLGRVILKSESNLYGKVYFAESYVYKDGKRALTVTYNGEVTLYKYNQHGEIESVYYPYSESLEGEFGLNITPTTIIQTD